MNTEMSRIQTETFGLVEMTTSELEQVDGGGWFDKLVKYLGGLLRDAVVVESISQAHDSMKGGAGPYLPPHQASGHAVCDNV